MGGGVPQSGGSRPERSPLFLPAVYICVLFFISGSVGLIYQVAWKHIFTIVFGNTTYAVSVFISVFMAGLALGSFVFGKVADRTRRHLLVLAALQAGIAISAILVPLALNLAEGLYGTVFRASESPALLIAVQVVVSAVILLVPTFLMGGTLPVLSRFLAARRRQVGPAVGLLYGLNTLGAAAGAFLTGFVLIKAMGVLYTICVAAAVNLLLAGAFLLLHRRWGAAEPEPAPQGGPDPAEVPLGRKHIALLLAAVTLSGVVSFSYGVLWTRLLTFRFQTTVYAFSIMLTTFLLGLGLGGAAVGLLRRRRSTLDYWRTYGYLETAIGICGLASVFLFFTPRLYYESFAVQTLTHLGVSILIMIVPTTLMGAAFPIACHLLAAGVERTGRSVGKIYVFNTIGAVTGALVTGFYLVRVLGTQGSLALASFLIIVSGSAILAFSPGRRHDAEARGVGCTLLHVLVMWAAVLMYALALGSRPLWVLVALLVVASASSILAYYPPVRSSTTARAGFIVGSLRSLPLMWTFALIMWPSTPADLLQRYFLASQSVTIANPGKEVRLLGYAEGAEGVVVVSELKGEYRTMAAGVMDVAGTSYILRNTQKLQAHIPMLIHPNPKSVCQIGFGSGETARIFLSYDVDRFDCAEISPVVLEVAATHFADINGGVLDDPKCNIILTDAAAYLRYTDRTYDVIANNATWPSQAGPAMLFTLEHFRNGRQRLNPGGIMTSWLPLDMPLQDVKTILRTFHEVFPHVYIWSALNHRNKQALIVGAEEPLQIDAARFIERFNNYARKDLSMVYLDDAAVLLACHLAKVEGMEDELADAPLSVNYLPVLQFMYSHLYRPDDMLIDSYGLLARHRNSVLDHLTNVEGLEEKEEFLAKVKRIDAANDHMLRAFTWDSADQRQRDLEMDKALKLAPEHPANALAAATDQELRLMTADQIRQLDLPALKHQAQTLLHYGLYDKAAVALEEWMAREPRSARPHLIMGMVCLLTHNPTEAITHLRTATSLDPRSADAQFQLGVAYVRANQIRNAVGPLQHAVDGAPASAEAHGHLGTVYARLGDTELAMQHLNQAVILNPGLAGAQQNLGALYLQLGDYQEAITHLERATALGRDTARTQRHLAEAYRKMGNEKEAARHLKRAQQLEAESTPPRPPEP